MTGYAGGRFELSHENNSKGSYLVVKAGHYKDVLEHEVMMLMHNRIGRVAAFDIKYGDGIAYCRYDITSRLTLSFFMKRRKLDRNEFIKILEDVSRTLRDCAGFLLEDSGFMLDAGCIYINPESLDLTMIYLPVRTGADAVKSFKELVIDIVLNHANLNEEGSDNFLQRILAYVRNDTFNLAGFTSFLDSLICGGDIADDISMTPVNSNFSEIKTKKPEPLDKPGVREGSGHGFLLPVVVSQLLIIAAVAIGGKYLGKIGGNPSVNFAAAALIIISFEVLVFKYIFENKLIIIGRPKEEKPPGSEKAPIFTNLSDKDIELNPKPVGYSTVASGNTVLLGNLKKGLPVLRNKNAAEPEEILVDKPDFIIGRLKEQVDYICKNAAIGKVHAQITSSGGAWFIKDLNSINGTFINRDRLTSNQDYEIRNGDCITMANSEYVVIL